MTERRRPELDGIRGLAILLVLCWHYVAAPCALLPSGTLGGFLYRAGQLTWSGVDLFFVLSGFLIGGILIDAKDSPVYYRTFYLRRAFRILPVYLLLCGVGVAVLILHPPLATVVGQPMPAWVYATFTQDFWMAHHLGDHYLGATWSLAVEEQFYLVLPFIIRYLDRARLPIVVAGVALASVIARSTLYLHFGSEWGNAAYTLVYCRADALMVGVLCALALRNPRLRTLLSARPWVLRGASVFFGVGFAVLLVKGWTMLTRPMSTVGYTCVALFYGSLLLISVVRTEGWWARVLRLAPLRWFGSIAYCLYLVHGLTFDVGRYLVRGRPGTTGPDWAAAAIGILLALSLSQVSWRYFESKMIAIGHRFSYAAAARSERAPRLPEATYPSADPG